MRELSRTPPSPPAATPASSGALVKPSDNSTLVISDEDVMIFEQMKYQLIVWLRVEAVRLGLDFANQTPLQLVDLLRQQEGFDETRLQILTTLLNLSDTVSAKGQAELVDYKQAMMFYLMHTRHAR
jgi:polyphosphate kinase